MNSVPNIDAAEKIAYLVVTDYNERWCRPIILGFGMETETRKDVQGICTAANPALSLYTSSVAQIQFQSDPILFIHKLLDTTNEKVKSPNLSNSLKSIFHQLKELSKIMSKRCTITDQTRYRI